MLLGHLTKQTFASVWLPDHSQGYVATCVPAGLRHTRADYVMLQHSHAATLPQPHLWTAVHKLI